MQRAADLWEQRRREQALANPPQSKEDRHLPTCACAQCRQPPTPLMVPKPLKSADPTPPALSRASSKASASDGRPEWSSDFVDDAKAGFDQLHRRRRLEECRRERKMLKQQQQQQMLMQTQRVQYQSGATELPAACEEPYDGDRSEQWYEPSDADGLPYDRAYDPQAYSDEAANAEAYRDWAAAQAYDDRPVGRCQRAYSDQLGRPQVDDDIFADREPPIAPALKKPKKGQTPGRKAQEAPLAPVRPVGKASRQRSNSVPVRAPSAPARDRPEDDGPCTRQMFDKRTSRMQHREEFVATIEESKFVAKMPHGQLPPSAVHVFIRKRPLFKYEQEKGEYDVVQVDPSKARCAIHNCLMHPDLHRMYIQHMSFPSTQAFPESSHNADVYQKTAQPLLQRVAKGAGAVALLLMYGQTGSGKTFTMSAIEELSARDLYASLPAARQTCVVVTVLEIAGKVGRDLLSPGRAEVAFAEAGDGGVQLQGIVEANPRSAEELLRVFADAKRRRATESTAINATSSRSHCITSISLVRQAEVVGRLVLVDCAGSERKEDSAYHSAERRKEGAEINASIYALKECMRAMTSGAGHVPFRNHLLTRALKENFTTPGAEIAVIATCSPTATDTEHSIGTLRTVCGWRGVEDMITTKKEEVPTRRQRQHHAGQASDAAVFNILSKYASNDRKAERVEARAADWVQKRKALVEQRVAAGPAPGPPRAKASRPLAAPSGPLRLPSVLNGDPASPRVAASRSRAAPAKAPSVSRPSPASVPRSRSADQQFFGAMQGMAYPPADGSGGHPKNWTGPQAALWVQQRCHRQLPSGVDGKALLRWNLARCVAFCDNDEKTGLVLFNCLRLEVDRVAALEKEKRGKARR